MAEENPEQNRDRKAIFRVPAITLLGVVFLMVCLAPAAFADVPGLWVLYVVPFALIVFVVRTRTVASAKGLSVRTMFGHRELPWTALKGLAITGKAKVRAVLADDSQVPLPAVRTRHLPVISLVSEGRFADPSGLTDELVGNGTRATGAKATSGESREHAGDTNDANTAEATTKNIDDDVDDGTAASTGDGA